MAFAPLSLDTPVQFLKGIGPKRAALLETVAVKTVEDLLHHFPRRYLDRSRVAPIARLRIGDEVTVVGQVVSSHTIRGRTWRHVVRITDGSGILSCLWFGGVPYLAKAFHPGETVAFSGKVTFYSGFQLVHPEYDKLGDGEEAEALHTGGIVPLYPSTDRLSKVGLDSRGFRRVIKAALNGCKDSVDETLSEGIRNRENLLPRAPALRNIHFPTDSENLGLAERRLKFEEFFFIQLYLALLRRDRRASTKGIAFTRIGERTRRFIRGLPFALTDSQKKVLKEIVQDMKQDRSMNRLLQGDVGAGKTVVALVAMLIAVENGYQTAFMAPTEILAGQHHDVTRRWLEPFGIRTVLLKGGQKESERQRILADLAQGNADMAIGTHALIQDRVEFKRLGLVVIDEQHRFGVLQRAFLRQKGVQPDVLVMTATPIPRTLALTLYGDLDVSVLRDRPSGRKPVRTVCVDETKRNKVYSWILEEIRKGRQAFIVYPLVEESEKSDLAAATQGYERLSRDVFPDLQMALLHGRMRPDEKEKIMKKFKSGEVQILVATTVVEVGIDVPNASVMFLEHAERFGLTQIHQLRGRIGRGSEESTCILMTPEHPTGDSMDRLNVVTGTSDGFRIAEADLKLRGPGELFGTRQHGELKLKIANLALDGEILDAARQEAFRLVEEDGELELPENRNLKETYARRIRNTFNLMTVG